VASALIDISQVKTSDFKDKTLGLKSRKAHPPAHQGTCVCAPPCPPRGGWGGGDGSTLSGRRPIGAPYRDTGEKGGAYETPFACTPLSSSAFPPFKQNVS
jgi:hypothetical protein